MPEDSERVAAAIKAKEDTDRAVLDAMRAFFTTNYDEICEMARALSDGGEGSDMLEQLDDIEAKEKMAADAKEEFLKTVAGR